MVNAAMPSTAHSMLTIPELLARVTGEQHFSKPDTAQAYHQVQSNEAASDLTINRIKELCWVKHLLPAIGGTIAILEVYEELFDWTLRSGDANERRSDHGVPQQSNTCDDSKRTCEGW